MPDEVVTPTPPATVVPPVVPTAAVEPPVVEEVPTKPALGGEPALVIGGLVSIIVAVLAIFGVVVDVGTVTGIVVALAPFVSAILIRFHVKPVVK